MQWCYLIFSAASLWWLLAFVEERGGESWPIYMALSIIYVAVIAFLALWLIPRRIFINISRRAAALVKLSLALNGLSATLLIQLFIKGWWVRALTLSGLFLVIWLGAWVFHRFLLTMAAETEAAFLGGSAPFDHTARQGRSARVD